MELNDFALVENEIVNSMPPLNRDAHNSRAGLVFEAVASRILTGRLPGGVRLDSVRALAGEFGVAAGTASAAVRRLKEAGLVARIDRVNRVAHDKTLPEDLTDAIRALASWANDRGIELGTVFLAVDKAWPAAESSLEEIEILPALSPECAELPEHKLPEEAPIPSMGNESTPASLADSWMVDPSEDLDEVRWHGVPEGRVTSAEDMDHNWDS